MDNLDINFLNKVAPQTKVKKHEEKKNKNRDRAFSSMEYTDYLKNWGPPSPLFKPLNSPPELPPLIELPPGLLSDLTEEDYRKVLSCPTQLKVLSEEAEVYENDEFTMMVEESNSTESGIISPKKFDLNDSSLNLKEDSNTTTTLTSQSQTQKNVSIITQLSSSAISRTVLTTTSTATTTMANNTIKPAYPRRQRSQSENIQNYSIYRFMENALSSNHE